MILWGRISDLSERLQLVVCVLVIVGTIVSLWWDARKAKAEVERLMRERTALPFPGWTIASGGGGGGGPGGGAGGAALIQINQPQSPTGDKQK